MMPHPTFKWFTKTYADGGTERYRHGERKQLVGAVKGLPGAAVHQNEGRRGFIGGTFAILESFL